MIAAIARLETLWPGRAKALGPRPAPVTDKDLQALADTVAPWHLPDDLVALLQWADGMTRQPWLPSLSAGPLLSAREIALQYELEADMGGDDALRFLLPLTHAGWWGTAVEIFGGAPNVVMDVSTHDGEINVLAPSLASVLEATADLADAGLLDHEPGDQPGGDWESRCREISKARFESEGWPHWPYHRTIGDPDGYPPHWRQALGLDRPADAFTATEDIARVLLRAANGGTTATVKGVIVRRELPTGQAEAPHLITLNDGTGDLHAVVMREIWKRSSARTDTRHRVIADVVLGDDETANVVRDVPRLAAFAVLYPMIGRVTSLRVAPQYDR